MENKETNEKVKKKNYSITIAILLIAVLIVAMICMCCSNNNSTESPSSNNNNIVNINSGEEEQDMDSFMFPEYEENTERDAEGNKVNISPNIKDGMTFDFLELSNISLKYRDDTTKFNASVMNTSDEEYLRGLELKIIFYDNDGREICDTHVLTNAIYAHKETVISSNITMDCSYANTFDIEIVKIDM